VSGRPAVFVDRDGTLIEDRHYLRDPNLVRLLPGAGDAIRRLDRAGLAVVVVTNQSGIARGLLTEEDYQATARRLEELLAAAGGRLAGQYHCPHLPEISGPCACRKPGTRLYCLAADELGLDLTRSWWVGDRLRDITAATRFGGRGLLVLASAAADEREAAAAQGWPAVADLAAAVDSILADAT
jgi:D-glycero-D-manno-heptose 1,7-bisphosphate phosphatase